MKSSDETVCKIYNTSHLEMIIQDLGKSIDEYNAKLVMVDSIIALHRVEFTVGEHWQSDNSAST